MVTGIDRIASRVATITTGKIKEPTPILPTKYFGQNLIDTQ